MKSLMPLLGFCVLSLSACVEDRSALDSLYVAPDFYQRDASNDVIRARQDARRERQLATRVEPERRGEIDKTIEPDMLARN